LIAYFSRKKEVNYDTPVGIIISEQEFYMTFSFVVKRQMAQFDVLN